MRHGVVMGFKSLLHVTILDNEFAESVSLATPFVFEKIRNFLGKGENAFLLCFTITLTLSQTTNFRLFQIERVCRRQY